MFHSLGRRLTAQIGLAITLGFIAVVVFFASVQQRNVLSQNERAMRKVTESVIGGVEAMMLSGHADAAELYASRLKSVADVVAFRIMRTNGLEAFKDNATIHKVNEIRGDEDFVVTRLEAFRGGEPVDMTLARGAANKPTRGLTALHPTSRPRPKQAAHRRPSNRMTA